MAAASSFARTRKARLGLRHLLAESGRPGMTVKRIVTNIATQDIAAAQVFYGDIFGMDIVMDHGWIVTYASGETMATQISFAREGGSGASVPDISIEIDNLDDVPINCGNPGFD
jgi:hypothetical protein